MKKSLVILLILSAFNVNAQQVRYSKSELKRLIVKQQAKINNLLVQVEQLTISHDRYLKADSDKFECLRQLAAIRDSAAMTAASRNSELAFVKQENEYLKSYLKVVKEESAAKSKVTPDQSRPAIKINASTPVRHSLYDNDASSYRRQERRGYITGPRGGCYYINGNGNKTYVDRSLCH